jgi:hypothetical protein
VVQRSERFPFDVFLSHSSKDTDVVRSIAQRLRADGLTVWFDEWVLKPGEHPGGRLTAVSSSRPCCRSRSSKCEVGRSK